MTIQVEDLPLHTVEVAVGAHATTEPYVNPPTRGTVPSHSALPDFCVVTESVTGQLTMAGEFDLACGDQFREASAAILAGDAAEAVVDFTRLRFIDTRGIDILIEFRNSLAVRGATLRIINADARIGRVFAICGLDAMLAEGAAPSRDEESTLTNARGTRFNESRKKVATWARPDRQAPVIVPAEPTTATNTTLSRIEKVMNLVLSARFSAASIGVSAITEHDRLQAELLASALDEALAEQRILWFEMAPTMATGPDGLHRYRDVSRHEMSRSEISQADVARSGVFLESEQQTGDQ